MPLCRSSTSADTAASTRAAGRVLPADRPGPSRPVARLAHASRRRLARGHDVHLLDTLRLRDGRMTEKMVDTALVADLLGLAFRREADRYVVVSDDDDMWSGVFAAEAAGARVSMLSRPGMRSRFMAHAADLVATYQGVP